MFLERVTDEDEIPFCTLIVQIPQAGVVPIVSFKSGDTGFLNSSFEPIDAPNFSASISACDLETTNEPVDQLKLPETLSGSGARAGAGAGDDGFAPIISIQQNKYC
jgi:hypothetical protein